MILRPRSASLAPLLALGILGATLASVTPARAGDAALLLTAEALFNEGRRLADQGNFTAACSKFEASEKLESAPGTLLHLADCREKLGQSASAWITFKTAAATARTAQRADWAELAEERAKELEPNLARLTITLDRGTDLPSIELSRDGVRVAAAEIGTPVPIDPGRHTLEVRAPGKAPWTKSFEVGSKARITVPIPPVDTFPSAPRALAEGPTPTPPPADAESESGGVSRKTVGFVVGGAGVVGLGFGVVSGLVAMGKNDESKRLCPDPTCRDANGIRANDAAGTWATVATVAFLSGAVLAGTGAVLVLTAPSTASSKSASIAQRDGAWLSVGPANVAMGFRFQ